jgi:hypothetical protein
VLGVAALALIAVVAFAVLSQSGGGGTNAKVATQTPGKPSKTVPVIEPLPSIQVLAGEVVANQGKNSFSFHFPTTWTASIQGNTERLLTIVLTPPASTGGSSEEHITFERQKQGFLELEELKAAYFGGIGTANDYYTNILIAKTNLGGKPGYHIASTEKSTPIRREAYFTVNSSKSYAFSVQSTNAAIVSKLAPTLQQVATSLVFQSH